jgi:glycosyltransferase involved in cell wall biosynthesis
MLRIGFFFNFTDSWMGGVNYIKNLLAAIFSLPRPAIEPFVFTDSVQAMRLITGLATIVQPFVRPRPRWLRLYDRCQRELSGSDQVARELSRKYKLNLVSHSGLFGRALPCPSLNWIPDFQHFRMPELFPTVIRLRRNIQYQRMVNNSTRIMVSSQAALNDLSDFTGRQNPAARVIHFVSQPDPSVFSETSEQQKYVLAEQLGVQGPFFYLPNQFWIHKNHDVVLRAVKQLKDGGRNVIVICTGFLSDYRNRIHQRALQHYITENGLESNIKILGLIEYRHVTALFRTAISILNPSFFEGWSSTVEEAKTLGAHCILSDIAVHREQDAPGAWYFDPRDPAALAKLLAARWDRRNEDALPAFGEKEKAALKRRTMEFGTSYEVLAIEAVSAGRMQ